MPKRRPAAVAPKPRIEKHAASARVSALLEERARLLREVEKKRALLQRTQAEAERAITEGLARMRPLVERERRLKATLDALFDELLREDRLAPKARKEVARVRAFLASHGVLPFFDEAEDLTQDEDFMSDAVWQDEAPDDGPAPRDAPPRHARPQRDDASPAPEVEGAPQAGQRRRSLRDIFRSLARLVHPDQARQEDERQRRTEVMKQVTRAYEDGDLARLIEIESAWQGQAALHDVDPEARALALARANRELLDQLRRLTAELRDSKQALREARENLPDEALVELATRELDGIEALAQLLQRFRDGLCSLAELKRGPWAARRPRSRAQR